MCRTTPPRLGLSAEMAARTGRRKGAPAGGGGQGQRGDSEGKGAFRVAGRAALRGVASGKLGEEEGERAVRPAESCPCSLHSQATSHAGAGREDVVRLRRRHVPAAVLKLVEVLR